MALAVVCYCIRRSETAGRSAPSKKLQHVYRCALTLPVVVILALAAVIANFADKTMKNTMRGASKFLRAGIYVIAGFMIFSQLDFASTIVNYAFIITLSAVAVAFAISFGIGGRDFAKNLLSGANTQKSAQSENSSQDKNEKQ